MSMTDGTKVEPAALRSVGRGLNTAAEESGTAFSQHHSGLADAAGGLFAGSRGALLAKSETWRATTTALVTRAGQHGTDLHTSAALYEVTDDTTSTALYQVTDKDRQSLNLDT